MKCKTIVCIADTLLHTYTFTRRRFYTQTLLHTETFTHTHTQTLLHTDTFTHGGNRGLHGTPSLPFKIIRPEEEPGHVYLISCVHLSMGWRGDVPFSCEPEKERK